MAFPLAYVSPISGSMSNPMATVIICLFQCSELLQSFPSSPASSDAFSNVHLTSPRSKFVISGEPGFAGVIVYLRT